jgi:hypothetical protein
MPPAARCCAAADRYACDGPPPHRHRSAPPARRPAARPARRGVMKGHDLSWPFRNERPQCHLASPQPPQAYRTSRHRSLWRWRQGSLKHRAGRTPRRGSPAAPRSAGVRSRRRCLSIIAVPGLRQPRQEAEPNRRRCLSIVTVPGLRQPRQEAEPNRRRCLSIIAVPGLRLPRQESEPNRRRCLSIITVPGLRMHLQ